MRRTNEPGERITEWRKLQCGKGTRWISANRTIEPDTGNCSVSSCNCGTKYITVGVTEDIQEAFNWCNFTIN